MARIAFTDAIGSATLDNGLGVVAGAVAAQFRGWTPFELPIGPARHALGTGVRYQFAFRRDYGARFRMEEIPSFHLPVVLRLEAHLLAGGSVRVETEDAQGRIYTSCGLAPGSEPQHELTDASRRTFTLDLALINLSAAEQMLCEYVMIPTPGTLIVVAGPDRLPGAVFARASTATYHAVS